MEDHGEQYKIVLKGDADMEWGKRILELIASNKLEYALFTTPTGKKWRSTFGYVLFKAGFGKGFATDLEKSFENTGSSAYSVLCSVGQTPQEAAVSVIKYIRGKCDGEDPYIEIGINPFAEIEATRAEARLAVKRKWAFDEDTTVPTPGKKACDQSFTGGRGRVVIDDENPFD